MGEALKGSNQGSWQGEALKGSPKRVCGSRYLGTHLRGRSATGPSGTEAQQRLCQDSKVPAHDVVKAARRTLFEVGEHGEGDGVEVDGVVVLAAAAPPLSGPSVDLVAGFVEIGVGHQNEALDRNKDLEDPGEL